MEFIARYYSEKDYNIEFLKQTKIKNSNYFSVGYNPYSKLYCYSEEEGYDEKKIKERLEEYKQNEFSNKIKDISCIFIYDLKAIQNLKEELFYYSDEKYIVFCNTEVIYYTFVDVLQFVSLNYKIGLNQILAQKNIILYSDFKLMYYTNKGFCDFDAYKKKWKRNFDMKFFPWILYFEYQDLETKDFKLLKRAKFVEDKLSNTTIKIRDLGDIKLKYEGISKVTGRIFCKDDRIYIQGLNEEEKNNLILPLNKGDEIIEFDFSSFEYRILYQILGIELNYDPHLETAKNLLNDETKREEAKQLNFRILYGGNIDDFQKVLNEKQLEYLETKLLEPRRILNDRLMEEYEDKGFIRNYFGRIIIPKKINGLLSNYISSTASDIIIYKMILLYKLLKEKKTRILTQIFDSIIINIDKNELEIVEEIDFLLAKDFKNFTFKVEKKYLKQKDFEN
jgi:hypothetical protein